jgi:hypothetical protein
MRTRALRAWAVLGAVAAVVAATVAGTRLADLAAGALMVASALLLVRLDSLGKRRRTRR